VHRRGDVERLAIYCTLYKYFGEGWRGGLPTSARLYAGELEELCRHSLKGLFSKIERLSDSTEGALSAVGEGIARLGLDAAAVALLPVAPATRVHWPALPSEKSWANGKTWTPFGPGRGSGWGSDCGGEGLRRKALRRVGGCRGSPAWRGWGR